MPVEPLAHYLRDLASASPAPGGGAAAALTVAQGLALLAMACNLTLGRKKFAAVEEQVRAIGDHVAASWPAALAEAHADMAAFGEVIAAYRLPANTRAEKGARQEAIAEASCKAAEPPLRLMALAAQALPLADQMEQMGNPNVVSDVRIARLLLIAGCQASQENVAINLQGLARDHPHVSQLRRRLANHLCARVLHGKLPATAVAFPGGQALAAVIEVVRTFVSSLGLAPPPLWLLLPSNRSSADLPHVRASAEETLHAFAAAGVPAKLVAEEDLPAGASALAELLASHALKIVHGPLPTSLPAPAVDSDLACLADEAPCLSPAREQASPPPIATLLVCYLACALVNGATVESRN